MHKEDFFTGLKEVLMIESGELNEKTPVNLTSLTTLGIMAFIDEHFNKQVKATELKSISEVSDLIRLIGAENIK